MSDMPMGGATVDLAPEPARAGGRADMLLRAGFSPNEVSQWAVGQRQTLTAAGFSPEEIDDHIGGADPKVPPAFLDRMMRGGAVGRVLSQVGAGIKEGYGTPEVMTPETEKFWRDVGIFNDPAKGQASPIRTLNEALMRPIAAGVALTGAAFNAGVTGLGRGFGAAAEEAGAPSTGPGRIGDEAVNFLNFLAASSMAHNPITRVERAPTGEVHDVPIGGLPKADSFANTTAAVLGGEPAPQAYAKVEQLWNDHGIHPAEVAHDAAGDVTITQDLAASNDRLPQAYVKTQPEAAPEAPAVSPAEPTPATFTTAKGSTYEIHEDGTTTRNKSFHPEHGEADQGPQPRSEATFYVTPEDAIKLGEIQSQGGAARSLAPLGDGRWGVKYLDGKDAGKFEARTVVTPETEPTVGATPVEIWNDGKTVHFGNEISVITNEAPPEPGLFDRLARSEEGTLRLGRAAPPRPPAVQSILDRLSVGETDAGRKWTWDRFYTAMIDRLHPIETATKEGAGGIDLKAADDPYKVARLYAGVSGKADQFLQRGTFGFNDYANTGKSLKEILAPVSDDLNDFRAYATSLRAMELEGKSIKTGMEMGDARDVVTAGSTKYAPVMAELVQYQNKLTQYLRDSGVLSDASYQAMTREHLLYVPFQRVFGDVMGDIMPDVIRGQGKTLQASDPIHEIVGSTRRVIDPLESIVRNTYLSIMMAERNAVGTKLADVIDAGHMAPPARPAEISFFRKGVKETREVDADLAASMKGLDEESVNTLVRFLGMPARLLRAGATLSPDFMLRNPIRDLFSAVVNTTKGAFTPIDTFKGFTAAIMKNAEFQEWMKGGGANSTLVSLDRQYLQQNLEGLTRDTGLMSRSWNMIRHPIDTLRVVSELTEQSTRLGEFMAARKRALGEGMTPKEAAQEAAFASREVTLDFARRGAKTKSMNMITAFFNAGLQSNDRLIRAFKDNPAGTSLKIAGGITLPSVLLWWANHDDPRWKEIPGWERDLFWLVMTKDHVYRIPKPFEVGVLFGSGVERALDAFVARRPGAFNDFAKSMSGALTPSVAPTFAQPFIEQWANRSSFTDRPLVPDRAEKQLPEYQYNEYTTETAKALGKIVGAFPGIKDAKIGDGLGAGVSRALSSPILMENYLRSWTGGLGAYALQAADASLRKAGVLPDPVKPEDTLADIPIVKAFVVRYPSAGSESLQRFYDEYDKVKVYSDTWRARAQEGDVVAMQHIQEMGGPQMFVRLDSINKVLGSQAKYIRDVYKNPTMTASDKRQLIDSAYMRETEIARHGVEIMRQLSR